MGSNENARFDPQYALRQRYIRFWRQYERTCTRLQRAGVEVWEVARYLLPVPPAFSALRCGARTRAGTPCKQNALYGNSRCKLHGGLSTGPHTPEGKAKVARNGFRKQTP